MGDREAVTWDGGAHDIGGSLHGGRSSLQTSLRCWSRPAASFFNTYPCRVRVEMSTIALHKGCRNCLHAGLSSRPASTPPPTTHPHSIHQQ